MCSLFRNRLFLYYPLFSFFFVVFFQSCAMILFFFGLSPNYSFLVFFFFSSFALPLTSFVFYVSFLLIFSISSKYSLSQSSLFVMLTYPFSSLYLLFSCLIFPLLPLFNSPSYLFFALSPVSAYNLRLTLCFLYASSQFITLLSSPLFVFALLSLLLPALSPVSFACHSVKPFTLFKVIFIRLFVEKVYD